MTSSTVTARMSSAVVPAEMRDQRLAVRQHDELPERARRADDAERRRALRRRDRAADDAEDDRETAAAERDADQQARAERLSSRLVLETDISASPIA